MALPSTSARICSCGFHHLASGIPNRLENCFEKLISYRTRTLFLSIDTQSWTITPCPVRPRATSDTVVDEDLKWGDSPPSNEKPSHSGLAKKYPWSCYSRHTLDFFPPGPIPPHPTPSHSSSSLRRGHHIQRGVSPFSTVATASNGRGSLTASPRHRNVSPSSIRNGGPLSTRRVGRATSRGTSWQLEAKAGKVEARGRIVASYKLNVVLGAEFKTSFYAPPSSVGFIFHAIW